MHLFLLRLGFMFTVFTLKIIKANEQTIRVDDFEEVCRNETRSAVAISGNFISEQRSRSAADCCQRCRDGCHGVLYNKTSQTCYLLREQTICPPTDTKYLCRKPHSRPKGVVILLLCRSNSPIIINIPYKCLMSIVYL